MIKGSGHGFWDMMQRVEHSQLVNDLAHSQGLNDIITAGNAVRDGFGSILEGIGYEVIAIGTNISEASRAFGSGRIGDGLVATEDLAVKVLPFALPYEEAAVVTARVAVNEARYGVDVVSRLGWFGGRTAGGAESLATRQRVLGNIAESKAARNASYFKIHTHVEDALTLDVRTELDAATFWSGKGNRMLAENYASDLGKTTLEITPGGKYLDSLGLFKSYPYEQAIRPWEVLSERFAQGASGRVAAFVKNASPTSIFSRIENPALQANLNVTEILFSPEVEYAYRFGRN